MKFNSYSSAFVFSMCVACAANDGKSTVSESGQAMDTTTQVMTNEGDAKFSNAANEIKERGLLKQVEDSGYPFVTLTIEFPERKFEASFSLNLEEAEGASASTISTWVGRYVAFTYTSELTNALLDLRQGGKSLLGMDNIELPSGLKKIKGTLSGAGEETTGDLPGEVTITPEEEDAQTFAFFITQEMVEANGEVVVGYYEVRTANDITSIKLIPN
ncbi:MAG: hypothetical protein ACKV1O_04215 [Saprospiraceae bacterium]